MQSNRMVLAMPGSHAARWRQCLPMVLVVSFWILLTSCSTAGVSQDQGLAQDWESWDSSRRKEAERVFETRIRSFIAQGTIPIIDVEHHFPGAVAIEQLVERMDRNGVALTWLGPGEKRGSAFSVSLHRRFPDRIVPTMVHGDGPLWHSRNGEFLRQLEEDAASGRYWAMGEFEARHYISSTNNRDVHLPVDSESFHVVFRISEVTGLPFLLHHEAEDQLLPASSWWLSDEIGYTPRIRALGCADRVTSTTNPRCLQCKQSSGDSFPWSASAAYAAHQSPVPTKAHHPRSGGSVTTHTEQRASTRRRPGKAPIPDEGLDPPRHGPCTEGTHIHPPRRASPRH